MQSLVGHCKDRGFYWVRHAEALEGSEWSDKIRLSLEASDSGSIDAGWKPP